MTQRRPRKSGFTFSISFLTLVNVITTVMVVTVGLVNALSLGPERLGVTAIIAALCISVSSLLNFRIEDAIASVFYDTKDEKQVESQQAFYLFEGALLAFLQALVTVVASLILGTVCIPFFTDHDASVWWIAAYSMGNGALSFTSVLIYLLRFSGKYVTIGYTRLLQSFICGGFFLVMVPLQRTLSSYFIAYCTGAVISTGFIVLIYLRVYKHSAQVITLKKTTRFKSIRPLGKMLISGNFFSYSQLLHKTADSLVVAYFCSDAVTGMYRIMRSLIHCLGLFYDAIGQVSMPYLLQLLEKRKVFLFWQFTRKTVVAVSLLTTLLLMGQFLVFPAFIAHVLGSSYGGIEIPTMLMSLSLLVTLGMQLWAWPVFLWKKSMNRLAQFNLAAAFLHLFTSALLYTLYPDSLWPGTLAFLINYIFLAPMYLWYVRKHVKSPDQSYLEIP